MDMIFKFYYIQESKHLNFISITYMSKLITIKTYMHAVLSHIIISKSEVPTMFILFPHD